MTPLPHLIAPMSLIVGLASPLPAQSALGSRLDSVAQAAAARGFHGNVLVSKDGAVVLLKGYGLANDAGHTPFGPATVVQIGSNVKDFTKVAVLQLVEAGRLTFTDSLGKFFPAAPPDKRAITIAQLLDHRAGLPLGVGPDEEVLPQNAFLTRLFARPLDFAPGTARQYSNAGYSVLAAIVEQITGSPFDAHLKAAIFDPLGMRETGLLLPHFAAARLAHGYQGGRDQGTMLDKPHTADGHYWNLHGNGGLLSTLNDMQRFYRALRGPGLLTDSAHRAMVLPLDRPTSLAGSDGTSFFIYASFPGAGLEFFVATNHAEFKAPRVLEELQAAAGIAAPGARRVVTTTEEGPRPSVAADPGAAATLQESGPGRTAAAFIAAFNSGDSAQVRHFFETSTVADEYAPPMATRLARYREMYGDLGRLTILSVKQTTIALEVTVRGEHGEIATLGFMTEPVAPFRLRGLMLEVGGP